MLRRYFFQALTSVLAVVGASPLFKRFALPEAVPAAEGVAASEEMCLSSYDWSPMSPPMVSERSKLFGISEADVEALIANQHERRLADQRDCSGTADAGAKCGTAES